MKTTLFSWLAIAGASLCHVAWTYSLKFIQPPTWTVLVVSRNWPQKWLLIGLWFGYFAFGALDSVLLSMAMRTIPTTTVITIWVSLSLFVLKLIDICWFHTDWSISEVFFLCLIVIGIIGLKMTAPAT